MNTEERIERLIEKHIGFRESFKETRKAFMPMWARNGKEFTALGRDMEISRHLAKTVAKIKEESNAE